MEGGLGRGRERVSTSVGRTEWIAGLRVARNGQALTPVSLNVTNEMGH